MGERTRLGLGVLGVALVLGGLGDVLLRATPWGINLLIWVTALVGLAVFLAGWNLSRSRARQSIKRYVEYQSGMAQAIAGADPQHQDRAFMHPPDRVIHNMLWIKRPKRGISGSTVTSGLLKATGFRLQDSLELKCSHAALVEKCLPGFTISVPKGCRQEVRE